GFVDQTEARPLDKDLTKRVIDHNHEDLKAIQRYYDKAGQDQARLVYFQGMMLGSVTLAVIVAIVTGILYLTHFAHWHSPITQAVLITIGMGAVGAIISVM